MITIERTTYSKNGEIEEISLLDETFESKKEAVECIVKYYDCVNSTYEYTDVEKPVYNGNDEEYETRYYEWQQTFEPLNIVKEED